MNEKFTSKMLIKLLELLNTGVSEEDLKDLLLTNSSTYRRLKYGLYTKKDPREGYWPYDGAWTDNARNAAGKILDNGPKKHLAKYADCFPLPEAVTTLKQQAQTVLLRFAKDYQTAHHLDLAEMKCVITDFLASKGIEKAVTEWTMQLDDLQEICAFLAKTAANHGKTEARKAPIRFFSFPALRNQLGFTSEEAARQILENDRRIFGELGDHTGDILQWSSHMVRHGANWGFLVNENDRIIGNFSMTFLTPSQEQLYRAGRLAGKDLTAESAASTEDEEVAIDLLNLSTLPEYAFAEAVLWERFGDRLLELAMNGTYFRSIYTCLFNEEQKPLFVKRGFRHIGPREGRGDIYNLDLTYDVPKAFSRVFPGLYEEYSSRFDASSLRFGPCPSRGELTPAQAQQIAGRLFSSDRYILSSVFHSYSHAMVLLGNLLLLGNDTIFAPQNIHCAYCGDRIIGVLLFVKGAVEWSADQLREEAVYLGTTLKDPIKLVESEYFPSYGPADQDTITILDDNIDPLWDSADGRVASGLMADFLGKYGKSYRIQAHVLQETREAIALYRANGFRRVGDPFPGFSTSDEKPVCFLMQREPASP